MPVVPRSCIWAPNGRSTGQVKRLDPDGAGGYLLHDEVSISRLMSAKLGLEVGYTLGAHNEMYPFILPTTWRGYSRRPWKSPWGVGGNEDGYQRWPGDE